VGKLRILRILFALTYYRPHVSGVTIYVERLAEALSARGHAVTVLTSRYDRSLPREEMRNDVRVVRVPVAFQLSKGRIMPGYAAVARRLVLEHDVVAVNLPSTPSEALTVPLLARTMRRPCVAIYHCDVQLPKGWVNRVVDKFVFADNWMAGCLADRFVAYTEDYAEHSPVLRRFPNKREVIPPPVVIPSPDPEAVRAFRAIHAPNGEKLIGFAARFATEKGVEYLLEALPEIVGAIPGARVLFAGPHKNVFGEEEYKERLRPLLEKYRENWTFLGTLEPEAMATFFAACDATVLPSINSTESFGLVQVESMLCGTPVVATDLPGVRVPIRTTGMGRIVPPRDSARLAEALIDTIRNREQFVRSREFVEKRFSMEITLERYETLFSFLSRDKHKPGLFVRKPS
jgi:glycosyltransferase involved in cell wall biosynthesis